MKLTLLSSLAALAGLGAAYPVGNTSGQANIDVTILQFALTLEHLENVFYKEALKKFSQQDFINAGFAGEFLQNLEFLVEDEQSHVELLTAAIQSTNTTPVAACQYKFPYSDVSSFVALSSVLEGIGTSAYLGAAALVTDKSILNTAASILVTESLHTSQQRGALGEVPAANALGTPVGPNAIFTLAASFIVSCPPSNPPLPFTAFPSLTANAVGCSTNVSSTSSTNSTPSMNSQTASTPLPSSAPKLAGIAEADAIEINSIVIEAIQIGDVQIENVQTTTITVCLQPSAGGSVAFTASSQIPMGSFLTFVSGLDTTSVQASISGSGIEAMIPQTSSGQTYVFVTKSAVKGMLMDSDVVAGPAVLEVGPASPVIDDSVL